MSKAVLRGATIYCGNSSIDISNYVESMEFSIGVGNASVTAFQDSYESHITGGLKRWSVRLSMLNAYDTSETYAVLQAAFSTNTTFPIFAKSTTAAVSATNPAFTGSCVLDGDFNVIGGSVGEAQKVSVTLKGAGTLSFITSASA